MYVCVWIQIFVDDLVNMDHRFEVQNFQNILNFLKIQFFQKSQTFQKI